jgi:hypothetical protein
MIPATNTTPLDPKAVQRAIDIMVSLPLVTSATPRQTIAEFADFFAEFSRATPLADVAALQGYEPQIIHRLIEAMVEWRRRELDNEMAALGAEEVRAHAELAKNFPSDPLPSPPATEGAATRRLYRLFGTYFRGRSRRD